MYPILYWAHTIKTYKYEAGDKHIMKDLTKGKPGKQILQFSIPIFLGNIVQLFYSLADTRIVGQTLGTNALAAVGATSTINSLIVGFLIGLTNGFSILVARDFGAKDYAKMKKSVAGALMIGIIASVVLTIVSVTFLIPFLRLLNMPEEHILEGSRYIRIILIGMTAAMLYNICASVLRAMGDTVAPLLFLAFSSLGNIALAYYFILVVGMGVEGAALATVLMQIASAVLCFLYIWKKYTVLHLKREDFRISRSHVSLLCKSGLSMGLMQSLVSLGTVALQSSINTLGTNIIVAHTAARKITELFMLPFSVFGMTMATYCGQNLGAGEIERIKVGIKKVLFISWIWCIGVIIASHTIAPVLIKMVTDTDIEEVIVNGSRYLRIDSMFYFVTAMITIFRNSLQGIGDHVTPIFSSSIELVGKILVVIWLTPKLHYMGIILAEPIVWILMVIPLIVQILRNPILKNSVRKLM